MAQMDPQLPTGGGYDLDPGPSDFKKGAIKPVFIMLGLAAVLGAVVLIVFAIKGESEKMTKDQIFQERKQIAVLPKADQLPKWREWAKRDDVPALQQDAFAELAWAHDDASIPVIIEKGLGSNDHRVRGQAAMALVQTLNELWPDRRKHLLLGMSADKPLDEILGILAPVAHSITCTQSRHPRACDAQRLAQRLPVKHERICVIPDVADAYTFVLNTSGPCDVIVVTGSLFLVGQLQSALRCSNSVTRVPPEMSSEEMLCR